VVIATRRNATRLLVGPVQAIAVGPDGVDKLRLGDAVWREHPEPERAKLTKALAVLERYISANRCSIPSYAERHLAGERISTGFIESTVNQVISKRMVKQQAMRWTPKGAHLLVQVRTRVLNDDLADDFRRWYPGFAYQPEGGELAA
jgi:hypothetical protein